MCENKLESAHDHPKCAICGGEKESRSKTPSPSSNDGKTQLEIQELCSWCALHHFNGSLNKQWIKKVVLVTLTVIVKIGIFIRASFEIRNVVRAYLFEKDWYYLFLLSFMSFLTLLSLSVLFFALKKFQPIFLGEIEGYKRYSNFHKTQQLKCPYCQAELHNIITKNKNSTVEFTSSREIEKWFRKTSVYEEGVNHYCPFCEKRIEGLNPLSYKEKKIVE